MNNVCQALKEWKQQKYTFFANPFFHQCALRKTTINAAQDKLRLIYFHTRTNKQRTTLNLKIGKKRNKCFHYSAKCTLAWDVVASASSTFMSVRWTLCPFHSHFGINFPSSHLRSCYVWINMLTPAIFDDL